MEKIVRVLEQSSLQQRTYTDKAGLQQVFNFMGFVLTDGNDTFYAELTGDRATRQTVCDPQYMYGVQLEIRHSTYTDHQGMLRNKNDIYLNSIRAV